MPISRRSFLKGTAAAAGLAALGPSAARAVGGLGRANIALPSLALETVGPRSNINHVAVLMMENRSVDHYLGWLGDERGRAGTGGFDAFDDLTLPTGSSKHWAPDYAGCGFKDPGHGFTSGRVQLGAKTYDAYEQAFALDSTTKDPAVIPTGWLDSGAGNDEFALGYYERADLPVTAALADNFTSFDRYFCSTLTSTYPNREYQHSATSMGIKDNSFPPQLISRNPNWATGFDWPTIWTLLENKGVTWAYYYSNLPVVALWGSRHLKNARPIAAYYAEAAAGTLPQVCFIDPFFVAPEGLANDDHPHADIRLGQELFSLVIRSFMQSSVWPTGALFINYDEWGGFFDHVPPPKLADDWAKDGFDQLGFRVPTMLASPWATGGGTAHGVYDHASILKFIEWNWDLPNLNLRDAASPNIVTAFNPAVLDLTATPDLSIDPAEFDYVAPPEAHIPCEARGHDAVVSDLWALAENGWFEHHGFEVLTS